MATVIDPSAIELKPGSGQMLNDKQKGKYWHIMYQEQHVGKVYIDYFKNEILGRHPAIEIFINQAFQGRQIGRFAYRKACEESKLKKIYMHARKSNTASIRAAYEAGFRTIENPLFKQVVMLWTKSSEAVK
ncbi:GNAT family N-acetyltransferase [Pedobacter jejuensis]|nr:GNAT family N-acetyltransferase [Pedobacter jejuensis]